MAAESILVVGGYGVVGGRIAADLAEDFPDRVVVAGRNRQRADVMAATIGYGARGRQVEVTDRTSIAAALAGVQVVVNCIDQPDRALMWAAVEGGLAYTDITPHLTDLGRGTGFERVDAAARAHGARILLGAGLVPGISNVAVRALTDALGGADRIETALLLNARDGAGPASFDYLLQELAMTFPIHVDGTDRRVRAFTRPHTVAFPAPLGPRPAYLFPFSDQVLYPRTLGAGTVLTRLSIDPPWMSRLLALLVRTHATRFTAKSPVRAAAARLRHHRSAPRQQPYALRVEVRFGARSAWATQTGRGQAHATATGAAALARVLTDAEAVRPGAWMPEQIVDPGPFFQRLARAGIPVETSIGLHAAPA